MLDGYNRCYSGVLGATTVPCCDPFDFGSISDGNQVMCMPSTDSADNGVSFIAIFYIFNPSTSGQILHEI